MQTHGDNELSQAYMVSWGIQNHAPLSIRFQIRQMHCGLRISVTWRNLLEYERHKHPVVTVSLNVQRTYDTVDEKGYVQRCFIFCRPRGQHLRLTADFLSHSITNDKPPFVSDCMGSLNAVRGGNYNNALVAGNLHIVHDHKNEKLKSHFSGF